MVGHRLAYIAGVRTDIFPKPTGHGAGVGYGMTVRQECKHCRFSERDSDVLLYRLEPRLQRYANQCCPSWEREPGIEG